VVVAPGGLAGRGLARSAGFDLPLHPLKGYSLTIPVTGEEAGPHLCVTDSERMVVYAQLGGNLRAAAPACPAWTVARSGPVSVPPLRKAN
jgi:D-amino-acid dehydrogenase